MKSGTMTSVALIVLLALLAGCTSLTPDQSTRLKQTQQFSDQVTSAYEVHPIKVIVDDTKLAGFSEYWWEYDWISIRSTA